MAEKTYYETKDGEYVRVKVVHSRHETYVGKYEETAIRRVYITFPFAVDRRTVAYAADDIFATHCQHSHDCCGHWYCSPAGYEAKKVRARTWMVPLHYSKNV